jgi:phosphoribosylformylglycinamidine cyclo-ligase
VSDGVARRTTRLSQVTEPPISYRDAGVDLEAARRHTEAIAGMVAGGETGFAAARPIPPGMREPMLVSCTDGVGTKLLLAQELGRIEGLGQDLVAMCVNDLVCTGARPLVFLDYLAVGRLDPGEAGVLVRSIADACALAGCALAGGETAEMPGLYAPGHFDLAGFATGVVEREEMLGPHRVSEGDAIVGIPSSGLHSNGYSLVRHVLLSEEGAGWPLDRQVDELGRTLGEELLEPTTIYAKACLDLARSVSTHAMSHVTGGGLAANLERVMPESLVATIDRGSWTPQPVFDLVRQVGAVEQAVLEGTLNCGVGMVALLPAAEGERAVTLLQGHGVPAWVCGEVTEPDASGPAGGSVRLTGKHPGW